jgi:hypothetical protein
LLIQKQTLHQQKAQYLDYLEPQGQERGMIRRAPRLLAAKSIGGHRWAYGENGSFRAGGRGNFMVMPHPLLWRHFKAEYLGFLLRYRFFHYKHFFPSKF